MQRIGITLAGLAALSTAAAHAQLERYMGGGVGNGAPPREALVIPYHLDFTDRLCLADYEHRQARCVQAVVTKLADFAGRPVGIARDPATGRVYVSTLKLGTAVPPGLWVIEPDGATRALPLPAGAAPYGVRISRPPATPASTSSASTSTSAVEPACARPAPSGYLPTSPTSIPFFAALHRRGTACGAPTLVCRR